jgi:hypothetical protein
MRWRTFRKSWNEQINSVDNAGNRVHIVLLSASLTLENAVRQALQAVLGNNDSGTDGPQTHR